MFDFRRAIKSALQTHPEDELRELMTPWGESLDPDAVLQEYPRPQMRRDSYINLNGWWEYAITESATDEKAPEAFDGRILVPFSPESALSHIKRQLMPDETLWYKRLLSIKYKQGMRYLLHFEAVDFECECFIDGKSVGKHRGGYDPFYFDITGNINKNELNKEVEFQIVLAVHDPSEFGLQPRGKQRIDRGSIWCTAQSGIWQTVWLEEVPVSYISRIQVVPNADDCVLKVIANITDPTARYETLNIEVLSKNEPVAKGCSDATNSDTVFIEISVYNAHLWSPDDPFLYDLRITYGEDEVRSYCAFRTFSVEAVSGSLTGKKAFCCNHEPLFLKGVLDQGYWPDGLLTAPSDEALIFDIEQAQKLGFNMMRKHIKVEQARWYYHCDKMGMIVWQDLVNGGSNYPLFWTSQLPTVFPRIANHIDDTEKLERFGSEDPDMQDLWIEGAICLMEHLKFFPSIATWTVFNEGWGQFFADEITATLCEIDDTRPFDQASGWFDQGGGNYISTHNYFRNLKVPKGRNAKDMRAPVISEFGGFAYHVPENSTLERAYGYEIFEKHQDFQKAVTTTLAEADGLESKGLSGYVYTQLTDVEEEVNGLITYDRKLIKYR